MGIANSLRRARRRSGASLRSIASRAGVGAGNLSAIENGRRDPTTSTVDKLASAIGVEWVPILTEGRSSAVRAAEEIAGWEAQGLPDRAYRRFIQLADDLATADAVTRVLLAVEEPDDSHPRWVDAIAALLEVRLREASAPLPAWVTERRGHPDVVWEPQRSVYPLPVSADLADVAPEFLRRGIAIERGELASA